MDTNRSSGPESTAEKRESTLKNYVRRKKPDICIFPLTEVFIRLAVSKRNCKIVVQDQRRVFIFGEDEVDLTISLVTRHNNWDVGKPVFIRLDIS